MLKKSGRQLPKKNCRVILSSRAINAPISCLSEISFIRLSQIFANLTKMSNSLAYFLNYLAFMNILADERGTVYKNYELSEDFIILQKTYINELFPEKP